MHWNADAVRRTCGEEIRKNIERFTYSSWGFHHGVSLYQSLALHMQQALVAAMASIFQALQRWE
jgi:hypothetical protein